MSPAGPQRTLAWPTSYLIAQGTGPGCLRTLNLGPLFPELSGNPPQIRRLGPHWPQGGPALPQTTLLASQQQPGSTTVGGTVSNVLQSPPALPGAKAAFATSQRKTAAWGPCRGRLPVLPTAGHQLCRYSPPTQARPRRHAQLGFQKVASVGSRGRRHAFPQARALVSVSRHVQPQNPVPQDRGGSPSDR